MSTDNNSAPKREIKYSQALAEAAVQAMEKNAKVFIFGVDVGDPKGIFGTTLAARKRFGDARVFSTPLSENALTGIAIGAALAGWRPILVHARNDFLLLTMDQIVNHAAKWRYMFGGQHTVPIVIRALIGRGWGQGAQHSQSLQALFAHIPGLKVVMPSNAYNAKGLLLASIADNNPVLFLEHRRLYDAKMTVPEEPYEIPLGTSALARQGSDVTVVTTSLMVAEALAAAQKLAEQDVSVEVIDLMTIRPYDENQILKSVRKTGRLVIADIGWTSFGVGSEIAAFVVENAFDALKAPIKRVALPDTPTPCSPALEAIFYPGAAQIESAALELLGKARPSLPATAVRDTSFIGPF